LSCAHITTPPLPQHPLANLPTNLRRLSIPPSGPKPLPLENRQNVPAGGSDNSNSEDPNVNPHIFNYYFLIIAAIACCVCIFILYIGRRKKRKAALLRTHGQTALARDVAGFRRFGRSTNSGSVGRHRERREDGLDERGEAPPPYVEGMKPPSISAGSVGRERSGHTEEGVELQTLSGSGTVHEPPGYHEQLSSETDMRRPTVAVLAEGGHGSARRLLSHSGSSAH
jgi:hypothetical protein